MPPYPSLVVDARLLADAVVDAAVAVVYEAVGLRLARRDVEVEVHGALLAFSVWWHGLAATGVLAALLSLLVAVGVNDLGTRATLSFLVAVPFTIGLAGLVYYLPYLYTGRRTLFIPIVLVYVLYNLLQIANLMVHPPTGFAIQGWRPTLEPQAPLPILLSGLVLLLLPPLAAAIAYLLILRRVSDATTRYRIALVSGSILAWLASVLLISQPALASADVWQFASRAVVLLSAVALYLAYRPPRFARERWGVAAL